MDVNQIKTIVQITDYTIGSSFIWLGNVVEKSEPWTHLYKEQSGDRKVRLIDID